MVNFDNYVYIYIYVIYTYYLYIYMINVMYTVGRGQKRIHHWQQRDRQKKYGCRLTFFVRQTSF